MNRADRRKERRDTPAWMRDKSTVDIVNRLGRNGITVQDMVEEYRRGYREGYDSAQRQTLRLCYSAAALAVRDMLGFGFERIKRFVSTMDKKIAVAIDDVDAMKQLKKETGYELVFAGKDGKWERVDDDF